jgi:hypothetical protein
MEGLPQIATKKTFCQVFLGGKRKNVSTLILNKGSNSVKKRGLTSYSEISPQNPIFCGMKLGRPMWNDFH